MKSAHKAATRSNDRSSIVLVADSTRARRRTIRSTSRWITIYRRIERESHRPNHVQDTAPRLRPRVRPLHRAPVALAVPVLRQSGTGTVDRPSRGHPERGAQVRPQSDLRHSGLQRVAGRSGVPCHLSCNRTAKHGHRRPTGVQQVRLSGKSSHLFCFRRICTKRPCSVFLAFSPRPHLLLVRYFFPLPPFLPLFKNLFPSIFSRRISCISPVTRSVLSLPRARFGDTTLDFTFKTVGSRELLVQIFGPRSSRDAFFFAEAARVCNSRRRNCQSRNFGSASTLRIVSNLRDVKNGESLEV